MLQLTGPQAEFVDQLVTGGCSAAEAARRAGFSAPAQNAYRLMRKPHVAAAVKELRERIISGDLANVAARTLREVMEDKAAPASARVAAARTVWEAAGHLGKRRDAGLDEPTADWDVEQLTAHLARLDAAIAAGALPNATIVEHRQPM